LRPGLSGYRGGMGHAGTTAQHQLIGTGVPGHGWILAALLGATGIPILTGWY